MIKPVVIDNYDSFTYNLVHLMRKILNQEINVFRNDEIDVLELKNFTHILLSPGPGIPSEAGNLTEIIRTWFSRKSILGVCLGHQAISEVFGATLKQMEQVIHGKESIIQIKKVNGIFSGFPDSIRAGRYHSWLVERNNLPSCLEITAVDKNQQVMAIQHSQFPIYGVQFHPESIMTPLGERIIKNWLLEKRMGEK